MGFNGVARTQIIGTSQFTYVNSYLLVLLRWDVGFRCRNALQLYLSVMLCHSVLKPHTVPNISPQYSPTHISVCSKLAMSLIVTDVTMF